MSIVEILARYRVGLLAGLLVTVKLAVVVWSLGLAAGTLVGVLGARWKLALGIPSRLISFALSGIPILVLLFWLHYPLQELIGVAIDPFYTAAGTLLVLNIFAVSDTVRNAVNDFPEQYVLAARVCGLSSRQTFLKIKFPIILRQILPGVLATQVNMLQMTLFASLISVDELFRVAQRINAQIYRPVEVYSTLGVFFLLICLPLNGVAMYLRQRYTRNLSER